MYIFHLLRLYLSTNRVFTRSISNMLGFIPSNISLYKLAFRHRSVAPELKKGLKNSNERLEFLGDAILGIVVAEMLFKKYPYKGEGFLTEMRSKIVSRSHLNQLAKKIGLDNYIEYDTRIINTSLKQSPLLGDAFEALIGAVYLDKGYLFTRKFIINHIIKIHVDIDALEHTETNFKSRLIEWCQRRGKEIHFELLPDSQENKVKLFTVKVVIDGEDNGTGQDYTKKNAEKIAAEKTYAMLHIKNNLA